MNLLDLVPHHAAASEVIEDRVVVRRPRPKLSGWRAPFDWLIFQIAPRRLKLDAVGSFCWLRIDGVTTAGEIAQALSDRFGDEVEPAEERLGRFIRSLEREELLSLSSR